MRFVNLRVNLRKLMRLKMPLSADSLLRNRDFFLMWVAATVSVLGGSISQLALPLTAVEILDASAAQMGLMFAFGVLPFVLFSIPAGVWLDRRRKHGVIVISNLLGCAALAAVPLAVMFDALSMPLLYAVEFVVGTGFCIGGSAIQVLLTQMVGRDRLVEANSKQASATSTAGLLGPVLGGMLVGGLGAPLAVTLDALAFLIAALLVGAIGFRESQPEPPKGSPLHDALEGLYFVWRKPMLRAFALMASMCLLLFHGFTALYVLHATRNLHLNASQLALVNTLAALGALTGAHAVHGLNRHAGKYSAIHIGLVCTALGFIAYAWVPGGDWAVLLAGIAMLMVNAGITVYSINYLSIRQMLTPDAMLSRMTSTMRFLSVSAAALGSVLSGYCADRFGLVPVLAALGLAGLGSAWTSRRLIARALETDPGAAAEAVA